LFLTSNSSLDMAEAAMQTGALGYIVKFDAGRDFLPAVESVLQGKRFLSRHIRALAVRSLNSRICEGLSVRGQGHVVQFYDEDAHLIDDLCALFAEALSAGTSVVALLTECHRIDLEKKLLASNVDLAKATLQGRLVVLDTADAIDRFMGPDGLNEPDFFDYASEVLRKAKSASAPDSTPVVFGEIVTVLCRQKEYESAIRLEQLWNELALHHSFYLCCAYPVRSLQSRLNDDFYASICAEHSALVSAF
jgi:hypothetical protein